MKILNNLSRLLIGCIFLYSGFIKGIDPLGFLYKFSDYCEALGVPHFNILSLVLVILISTLEFLIGISLILNIKTKWSLSWAMILTIIFIPITLWIAITDKVINCGCFGDAIYFTNWESFIKNIIIIVILIPAFLVRKKFKSPFNVLEESFIYPLCAVFMILIEIHSLNHLPFIDFRAYAIGNDINKEIEKNNSDNITTLLEYKNIKTGKIKDFELDNYPWKDSLNWKFVQQKNVSISGERPPINFTIIHPTLGDISHKLLSDKNFTFLYIARDLDKAKYRLRVNDLINYSLENHINFYGITASDYKSIDRFKMENNINFDFCTMDGTEIKTIIRSNSGLLLLNNGIIIDKWSSKDIPRLEDLQDVNPLSYSIKHKEYLLNSFRLKLLILIFITLLLLYLLRKYRKK